MLKISSQCTSLETWLVAKVACQRQFKEGKLFLKKVMKPYNISLIDIRVLGLNTLSALVTILFHIVPVWPFF